MLPRAYNPIRIVLEKRVVSQVAQDDVYGTSIGQIPSSVRYEFEGQLNVYRKPFGAYSPSPLGNKEKTSGRIYIRKDYYDTMGFVIEKGDRIVETGPIGKAFAMDAMVINVRPAVPLGGDFLFICVEFEQDREHNA